MEFSVLTEKEIKEYGIISRQGLLGGSVKIMGCKVDGEVCAYAALEKMDDIVYISGFFVREDRRGSGIGTALLDTICNYVITNMKEDVMIDYRQDEEGALRLEGMLFRRGFRIQSRVITHFKIEKKELEESYLAKMNKSSEDAKKYVFPLQVATAKQMKELIFRCEEKGNYITSRADYVGADRKLSKILLVNQKIEGVILMENSEDIGEMEVALLYIDPRHIKGGFQMLKETFDDIMEPTSGVSKINFVCANESSLKLVKGLFPECEGQQEWIARGILRRELYQKRG